MKLTKRQLQLLPLLKLGDSNATLATKLGLSQHTVKVHLWRLFKKIEVNSRGQAVAYWTNLQMPEAKQEEKPAEQTRLSLRHDEVLEMFAEKHPQDWKNLSGADVVKKLVASNSLRLFISGFRQAELVHGVKNTES